MRASPKVSGLSQYPDTRLHLLFIFVVPFTVKTFQVYARSPAGSATGTDFLESHVGYLAIISEFQERSGNVAQENRKSLEQGRGRSPRGV
jgi:hypothetical protein